MPLYSSSLFILGLAATTSLFTNNTNWTGFSDLELYFDVIIPKGSNNTATILINNTGVYRCDITNHTQCTAFDYGNTNSSDILAEILDPQRWQLLS